MKKMIVLLILMGFVFLLAACGIAGPLNAATETVAEEPATAGEPDNMSTDMGMMGSGQVMPGKGWAARPLAHPLKRKDRRKCCVYVIMLTAKNEETDKIIGLSVGADDYLTKTFSPRELVARIKAALRRLRAGDNLPDSQMMRFQHLLIDPAGRRVWVDEQKVELTSTKFDLLKTLAAHPGMVLSREQLLEQVCGQDFFGEIWMVGVHLGHVRQKLSPFHGIVTVHGIVF